MTQQEEPEHQKKWTPVKSYLDRGVAPITKHQRFTPLACKIEMPAPLGNRKKLSFALKKNCACNS